MILFCQGEGKGSYDFARILPSIGETNIHSLGPTLRNTHFGREDTYDLKLELEDGSNERWLLFSQVNELLAYLILQVGGNDCLHPQTDQNQGHRLL